MLIRANISDTNLEIGDATLRLLQHPEYHDTYSVVTSLYPFVKAGPAWRTFHAYSFSCEWGTAEEGSDTGPRRDVWKTAAPSKPELLWVMDSTADITGGDDTPGDGGGGDDGDRRPAAKRRKSTHTGKSGGKGRRVGRATGRSRGHSGSCSSVGIAAEPSAEEVKQFEDELEQSVLDKVGAEEPVIPADLDPDQVLMDKIMERDMQRHSALVSFVDLELDKISPELNRHDVEETGHKHTHTHTYKYIC